MKAFSKLVIVFCIFFTACSEDDNRNPKLSQQDLLIEYNWIVFSVVLPPGKILDGEPEILYHVLDFNESEYSGSDFTGTFYNLGNWSVEGDVLVLDEEIHPLLELTASKLVYEISDGRIVTRLPVKKDM